MEVNLIITRTVIDQFSDLNVLITATCLHDNETCPTGHSVPEDVLWIYLWTGPLYSRVLVCVLKEEFGNISDPLKERV